MASNTTEREMTTGQRHLVDDCFDEGQYEIGISTLNGLRDSSWNPSPEHIRQLIYLALYPPPEPTEASTQPTKGNELPEAPGKLGLKPQKQVMIPAPSASIAAQDLLLKFAATNSPESLFSGLPKYPVTGSDSAQSMNIEEGHESFIARHSKCIRTAKSCWEILREGFVQRREDTVQPRPKRGRRTKRQVSEDEDALDESWSPTESRSAVGEHSWAVLQWLLAIFEREEILSKDPIKSPYSLLLLSQIPPPRMGSGGRWDVDAILDVICYCVQQDQERRKLYGTRLLTLVVNLTNTTELDMIMFSNIINNRLSTLPFEDLTYLLQGLPPTPSAMHFKLNSCRVFLSQALSITQSTERPKPQPRALPKSRSKTSGASTGASTPTLTSGPSSGYSTPKTRKLPAPSSADILRLLVTPQSPNRNHSSESLLHIMEIKFQLVQTYVTLQPHGWEPVFANGQLAQAVVDAFTVQEGEGEVQRNAGRYRSVLQARLAMMKPSSP